ncbi:MAG: tetratricopeptide repeat protein [Pirellulaceae bacterium]|nr:tetratricopeptide repeat protein [Pirellulaceae bacterium]
MYFTAKIDCGSRKPPTVSAEEPKAFGNLELAVEYYQQAIRLNPRSVNAYNNIGNVFLKQEHLANARQAYLRAIELSPRYLPAHRNLAISLRLLGEEELAKKIIRTALDIDPNDAESLILLVDLCQQTCQWNGLDELCKRVTSHVEATDCEHSAPLISPFTFMAMPTVTTAEQQLRCASQWGRAFRTTLPVFHKSRNATASSERPSKLRIGYLSADFRSHVVGYIVPEWFESHDRSRFEVFGYSIGVDDKSPIRKRIVDACNEFRDCHELTFQETARSIAADEIDILVDLQGYTQLSRPQILAYRPASIQVNYLGYPGTMGVDFIDSILVDEYVVPSSQQPAFTERLVHLPGCYLVTDSQRTKDLPTIARKSVGLPEDAFVFCAFSTTYKLTAKLFDIWLNLLSKIPNSILWLRYDREPICVELRRRATERGIDSERLAFAPSVSLPEHLDRQKLADLFLDTFPYNQHSTASDALRVGLPLLTLSGQTFSSRVAGSLLLALNLPELITDSFEAYENTALHFARHPIELQRIRNRLSAELATTELFSGQVFARNIENAFDWMWERHSAGGLSLIASSKDFV